MNAKTIGYWATTGLSSAAILGSGVAKLTGQAPLVEAMTHLGYPLYVMQILGFWYVGAAVALLAPGLPRLKEWAYAGVTFALTGATYSHLAAGDPVAEAAPTLVLLALALASWALRPASRRLGDAPAAATGIPVLAK